MPDPLWNRVHKMEDRDLYTIARRAEFRIVAVDEQEAELRLDSTGGRALVRRNFLEPMWEDLQEQQHLVLSEWMAASTLPGSTWVTKYAAPILAELEEVKVETDDRNFALVLIR